MKAIFLGFAAAALIAVGAGLLLTTLQTSSAQRYSTQAVRL